MVNEAYVAAFASNIISFVTGTSVSWSSPILPKLNDSDVDNIPFGRQITSEESSWIGSLLSLGAIFGPFIFGFLTDRIGRKFTLISIGIPYVVGFLIFAFSKDVSLYYVARIFCGIAGGGSFTVIPMYIGEIAEDSNRGALGSVMNLLLNSGLLFSYIIGPYIPIMVFSIILAILPVCFMVLVFFIVPESPTYLVSRDNLDAASKSLNKLRGSNKTSKELDEIKSRIDESKRGTMMDVFKSKGLIKGLIISTSLVSLQQLSGINVLLVYAQTIFNAAGGSIPSEVSSMIIGGVLFITSFFTPLLVERVGRKMLLYISSVGIVVSQVPIGLYFYLKDDGTDVDGISWLPVVALVVYIITYNCGYGPLPWTIMGELFPPNVKSVASSVTSTTCWTFSFLTTKFFPSVVDGIGIGPTFWLFSGFCVVGFFFTMLVVVETKGKSLDEIQKDLEK